MDALNLYAEAKLWGSFDCADKKREDFERLRDLYEARFGKLFKRP